MRNPSPWLKTMDISQARPSLLEVIYSISDAKVLRYPASELQPILQNHTANRSNCKDKIRLSQRSPLIKRCPLCKKAGRNDQYFLCKFLPEQDKQAKARQIVGPSEIL